MNATSLANGQLRFFLEKINCFRPAANTIQSGFGSGAPRGGKFTGVVEGRGRGRGGYLQDEVGVGRTGKAPARVSEAMVNAMPGSASGPPQGTPNGLWGISLEDLQRRDNVVVSISFRSVSRRWTFMGLT